LIHADFGDLYADLAEKNKYKTLGGIFILNFSIIRGICILICKICVKFLLHLMKKTDLLSSNNIDPGVPSHGITRRDFFGLAWKGLGFIAALEAAGMVTAYFFSGKNKKILAPKQLLEAGPVDSFELNSVNAFMGGRFYLARQQDGGFIALSLRCTHLGCSITWEENKKRFICPCHSSAFDIGGEVLNPPAARALDYYPVLIENGIVKVDIGTLKERKTSRKDQLTYAQ
jgi:cytochrome b6-f complex iron-sulfur subunit